MDIKTKGIILSAESKPYDFDGNKGTSHNIRVSVAGEIYTCKSNSEQVSLIAPFKGQTLELVIRVNSRKERMSLELVSAK